MRSRVPVVASEVAAVDGQPLGLLLGGEHMHGLAEANNANAAAGAAPDSGHRRHEQLLRARHCHCNENEPFEHIIVNI